MQTITKGDKPVTNTVLTLWPDFAVPKEQWKALMFQAENKIYGRGSLWPLSAALDGEAKRIADAILEKWRTPSKPRRSGKSAGSPWAPMGPNDALAQVSWLALTKLRLLETLLGAGLALEKALVAMCIIAARMIKPASERRTFNWLRKGGRVVAELAGLDFRHRYVSEMYRLSVILLKHKDIIINSGISKKVSLLNLYSRYLLYDITNIFFEGNPKSIMIVHGRSKEKRSDRPLLSIGVISDDSNYIRMLKFLPGNVSEAKTLKDLITSFEIDRNTIISMDRGIATEENIEWLNDSGYKYIVGSRERRREFDKARVTERLTSKSGNDIELYVDDTARPGKKALKGEIRVRCLSTSQRVKDTNIISARREKFENGLRQLDKRCHNLVHKLPLGKVMRRIGGLDSKYGVSSHYKVDVRMMDSGGSGEPLVEGVSFKYTAVPLSKADRPGVYALRTNVKHMAAKEIVEAYFKLTDIESVFKAVKSELGVRPVFHYNEDRIFAHVLIAAAAFQGVTWIRNKLKANGITDSWTTIKDNLMDVNCAAALSKDADKAEREGTLYPEVEEARKYFKALGLSEPIKPMRGKQQAMR